MLNNFLAVAIMILPASRLLHKVGIKLPPDIPNYKKVAAKTADRFRDETHKQAKFIKLEVLPLIIIYSYFASKS